MASPGKRILIIVENLPVPFDKRVWNKANRIHTAGYDVSIICPKAKGYEKSVEELNGIRIHRHPMPAEGNGVFGYAIEYVCALFWEFVLTFKVCFNGGFDAIHACNPPDDIFLIGFFFKCFGKRFVFDHHDINPELFIAKFGKKNFFYHLMVFLERLTFKTADISIATNQSYKEIAVRRGGMDPEKVFIVRSGPDVKKLIPVTPLIHLKEGRPYMVCYVGVMGKQEGIDILLKSIKTIVNERKRHDISFVIIGGGPEFEHLKQQARKLGLGEELCFTGRIPDKELIEYLSTSDVCVNPDVANEMNDKSTMNKIMEYMALAKPIVQFDLTEGRFSAMDASLYAKKNDAVDFADKILELLDNPALRQRMGTFGRKRVMNELAWEYSEKELLRAYRTLFQKGL